MKKELGIFILLVVLCIIGQTLNHQFFSAFNIFNNLNLIGMFGIFSLGMGLVIITGGIDLSVGSVMALEGVLFAMMLTDKHFAWPLALLLSIVLCVAIGAFHGFLITRVRLQPFIVTLCGLLFYRGIARFVTHDETKGFGEAQGFQGVKAFFTGSFLNVPVSFYILLAVSAVMWVLLHRSIYGRYLYAAGRSEDAARYSGINTRLVISSAYVILGLLTALSGILFAFYTNSIQPSSQATSYELYGVAAAVLGGCSLRGGEGSVLGILFGTILLIVLQNLVNLLGIPSSLNFAVMGAVILLGVLADQLLKNRKPRVKAATVEAAMKESASSV